MTKTDISKQLQGTIYVHNQPGKGSTQAAWSDLKNSIIKQYNNQNLSSTLISKLTGASKISLAQKKAFFSFYGGAQNWGQVQRILSNKISSINLPTALDKTVNFNNLYDALYKLKNNSDIKAIEDINSWIEQIIKQLSGTYNLYGVAEDIIKEDFKKAINKGAFSVNSLGKVSETYELIKNQIFNQDQGAITIKTNSKEFASQKNIIRLIHIFQQFLNQSIKNGTINQSDQQEVIYKYTEYLIGRVSSLIGYAYQPIVASLQEEGKNEIISKLIETGSESVQLSYTPKQSTNNEKRTTISTRDLKISLNNNKLSKELSMELRIPNMGASLKYNAGLRSGKTGTVKIKDKETLLGTLLHNLDNQSLSYIYNIIANYKRKAYNYNRLLPNTITRQHYVDMWQGLKIILLINGLVGQMTKEDFSYYFIVSNRVYTIADIITSIIEDSSLNINGTLTKFDIAMANVPVLNPSQKVIAEQHEFISNPNNTPWENALERSKKVVQKIQEAKLKAGIRMKITEL